MHLIEINDPTIDYPDRKYSINPNHIIAIESNGPLHSFIRTISHTYAVKVPYEEVIKIINPIITQL